MKKLIVAFILLTGVFFAGGVFAQENCTDGRCGNGSNNAGVSSGTQSQQKYPGKGSQDVGINVSPNCLINGGCSFSIYDALEIRKDMRGTGEQTSVMIFAQDIILALTGFIGTVVTLALIVSGIYYLMSPIDSGNRAKAMKGIKYSVIGLIVVMSALVIIRLVQFIAKGGS